MISMAGSSFVKYVSSNFSKHQSRQDERENLSVKSRIELMDLLCREEKLCKNTKFLEKLPDKGAKILKFYEQVKTELQRRDNQETLCGELAKLTVDESKSALDRLEWTGDYRTETAAVSCEEDDTNLYRILATHSGTEVSKTKNIKCESEVETQPSAENDSPTIDAYAKELCQRVDSNTKSTRKKFYTHKPLIKDEHKAPSDSTELPPRNGAENPSVKMLSLQESLTALHHQNRLLKEIEFNSAIEKLRTRINLDGQSYQCSDNHYRDHSDTTSNDEASDLSSSELEESDD